jgi:glucose/arabinose dehydrogenase
MRMRYAHVSILVSLAMPMGLQQRQDQNGNLPEEQRLGQRIEITADNLPQPNADAAVSNAPLIVPRDGRMPMVPEGFTVTLFAEKLEHPRRLLVLPNGDVIVAEQKPGHLTLLRDADGDGTAEWIQRHAEGFSGPYGLAWRDGTILVADQVGIWAVPHKLGEVRGTHGEPQPISQVPPEKRKPDPNAYAQELITGRDVFGIAKGHANRDLEIAPDGRLFVGVGSSGNIGVEPEPKATIQVFSSVGRDQQTYASGMRNPTDLAFHPQTGELWAIVQERDGMGDGLVPEFLTQVKQGAFYGWPYSYIGSNPQPGFADRAPDKVRSAVVPDVLIESHSSVMGLVFYNHEMFPEEYRGDAFVALKGSWNRSVPTGYKVVRVKFQGARPETPAAYENFVTGFWVGGEQRAEVWGRPAALAVAKDGALLIADDTGGTIWRIAHGEPARTAAATQPAEPEPREASEP